MPEWALSIAKWTAAVVVLVLVVGYTAPRAIDELRSSVSLEQTADDEDEELPEADPEETDPQSVISDEQIAVLDLSERNGTVQQVATETIVLGPEGGQQMLIGFEHIPADTACLLEVRLAVVVLEGAPARIHVHPAQLLDPHDLTDGAGLAADTIIDGAEPAAAISDGSAGTLLWDVTDIYTLASREAPGDVVMLSMTPQLEEESEFLMVLGAVEGAPESVAKLLWSAVEGCDDDPLREGGTDTPGGAEEEEPVEEEPVEEEESVEA